MFCFVAQKESYAQGKTLSPHHTQKCAPCQRPQGKRRKFLQMHSLKASLYKQTWLRRKKSLNTIFRVLFQALLEDYKKTEHFVSYFSCSVSNHSKDPFFLLKLTFKGARKQFLPAFQLCTLFSVEPFSFSAASQISLEVTLIYFIYLQKHLYPDFLPLTELKMQLTNLKIKQ